MTEYDEVFALHAERIQRQEDGSFDLFATPTLLWHPQTSSRFETYFDAQDYAQYVLKADIIIVTKETVSEQLYAYMRERGLIAPGPEVQEDIVKAREKAAA